MKRIFAVNSNCYHGYSLDEAIAGISEAGFRFIELTATKGWTEHVFPTMSLNQLWEIREKLQAANLIPFSMSGHTNLMDTERIPDFIANMRLANFFKCDYIVSSIGEAHLKDKAVVSNEEVAQHIAALVPHLEAYELQMVLENHGEHATGEVIKKIVDLVGCERVGINYDTANVIYFAGINPMEDMPKCIDQIKHLHLKDKIGGEKEWHFPAIGKGTIEFPKLFKLLDDAGNDSPVSIEIEFTSSGAKDLAEINQAVHDSYAYLKGLGFEI